MRTRKGSPPAKPLRGWLWGAPGLAALVVVGLAGWRAGNLPEAPEAAQAPPRLVVNPPAVDFGTIRKSGGKVEATFRLQNQGQEALRIRRIVPT